MIVLAVIYLATLLIIATILIARDDHTISGRLTTPLFLTVFTSGIVLAAHAL
jgi:hypothetical protein